MDLRPGAIIGRFRGKFLRYASASVFGTVLTQALLFWFVDGLGWTGAVANVVAVTLTCIPAFVLSKRWVWRYHSRAVLHREVTAFWGMNLLGLALSTVFAAIAYALWAAGWAVSLANMAGFGLLWVAKFLVLDEFLFPTKTTTKAKVESA